jgi:hypothetical protein
VAKIWMDGKFTVASMPRREIDIQIPEPLIAKQKIGLQADLEATPWRPSVFCAPPPKPSLKFKPLSHAWLLP